jgi:hypothetical protein
MEPFVKRKVEKMKRKYNLNNKNLKSKPKIKWKTLLIALYLTFIFLSTIPYIADRVIEPKMKDSYEYHLIYRQDGLQSHYYVERFDTNIPGRIDLTYTTISNSLVIQAQNIKILHIYCRSMYEDECLKVFGVDPADNSNYYKWYFIEKNHLNVNVDTDQKIEELKFIDTPIPYRIVVNGNDWYEGTNYNYTDNYSTALSNVPARSSAVDIYFKSKTGIPPEARLNANKKIVATNQTIDFDASESFDKDGTITTYILDLGDSTFWSGSKFSHKYSSPGIYGVILMVRDNDELVDHAYLNITVIESSDVPIIQGVVPDQIKPEDSPPWILDLNKYEPIPTNPQIEFQWYLTGENNSLYTLSGENDTNGQLIFSPKADKFGTDQVTLWLISSESLITSQQLWINITPINDPPSIYNIPDLIIHYDVPYTFNYEPYVSDKESLLRDLKLAVDDGYEEDYTIIDGLNITYNYPQKLVGEIIIATISVSDGENTAEDVIAISVTSNYVPKVVRSLPDLWIYEGSTKNNVFDLDDYFTDPDDDSIYFTYGFSHLDITIKQNHSVDLTAASEWTGTELVTFRAHDPIGAIAEDVIIVTIIPLNDPPKIEGVPNLYVHYDHRFKFELTPFVNDNDNTTDELKIIPSDRDFIKIDLNNNMVIVVNYPKRFLGQTIPVRLLVSDGLDTGFQDITITVTDDYPPELIKNIPDFIIFEDVPLINAFNINNYFIDLDGDALYYTSGNKNVEITIHENHSIDISSPLNWYGSELIYFRATDPIGALQQDLVIITVLPVNDAPMFLDIPIQRGNISKRWELDMENYITDVDHNISQLTIFTDNEFVIVSGKTLIFFGSPKLPKEITVTVSDGELSTSESIKIHLNRGKSQSELTLWDLFIFILPYLILIILLILCIASIIIHRKNKFTAEEVFLIHQGGTLITHLSNNVQANVDDIIFSGMFTAVQDFIKDTFSSDNVEDTGASAENWALDELKFGGSNILIGRSENTYLAVIFTGPGSKKLRKIVNELLDLIEIKYEKILPIWDGNINVLKGTNDMLSVLISIQSETKEPGASEIKIEQLVKPEIMSKPAMTTPIVNVVPIKKPTASKMIVRKPTNPKIIAVPGLASLPLDIKKRNDRMKALSNLDLNNSAIALRIQKKPFLTKTIVIKRGLMVLERNEENENTGIESSFHKSSIKRKIIISESNKKIQIDPTRSLFEQLAEMDD